MVTINNSIDSNYKARIYYKDEFIGECLNELAFLNVRLQVKMEQDENYSFELVRKDLETGVKEISGRYKLGKNGQFIHPVSFQLYWPSYDNILSNLLDF